VRSNQLLPCQLLSAPRSQKAYCAGKFRNQRSLARRSVGTAAPSATSRPGGQRRGVGNKGGVARASSTRGEPAPEEPEGRGGAILRVAFGEAPGKPVPARSMSAGGQAVLARLPGRFVGFRGGGERNVGRGYVSGAVEAGSQSRGLLLGTARGRVGEGRRTATRAAGGRESCPSSNSGPRAAGSVLEAGVSAAAQPSRGKRVDEPVAALESAFLGRARRCPGDPAVGGNAPGRWLPTSSGEGEFNVVVGRMQKRALGEGPRSRNSWAAGLADRQSCRTPQTERGLELSSISPCPRFPSQSSMTTTYEGGEVVVVCAFQGPRGSAGSGRGILWVGTTTLAIEGGGGGRNLVHVREEEAKPTRRAGGLIFLPAPLPDGARRRRAPSRVRPHASGMW